MIAKQCSHPSLWQDFFALFVRNGLDSRIFANVRKNRIPPLWIAVVIHRVKAIEDSIETMTELSFVVAQSRNVAQLEKHPSNAAQTVAKVRKKERRMFSVALKDCRVVMTHRNVHCGFFRVSQRCGGKVVARPRNNGSFGQLIARPFAANVQEFAHGVFRDAPKAPQGAQRHKSVVRASRMNAAIGATIKLHKPWLDGIVAQIGANERGGRIGKADNVGAHGSFLSGLWVRRVWKRDLRMHTYTHARMRKPLLRGAGRSLRQANDRSDLSVFTDSGGAGVRPPYVGSLDASACYQARHDVHHASFGGWQPLHLSVLGSVKGDLTRLSEKRPSGHLANRYARHLPRRGKGKVVFSHADNDGVGSKIDQLVHDLFLSFLGGL